MKHIIITLLIGLTFVAAENTSNRILETKNLAAVATVDLDGYRSLEQAIWDGIVKLQKSNDLLENGIVEIIPEFGDPIYVAIDLKKIDDVRSGEITLKEYIRNYTKFQ